MRLLHLFTYLILLVSISKIAAQLPSKLQKTKNKVSRSISNGYFYKARKANTKLINALEKTDLKIEIP